MTQTLSEKLRIIADAVDSGEDQIQVDFGPAGVQRPGIGHACWLLSSESKEYMYHTYARIPAQIKVSDITINAPMRVMPKIGAVYWWISGAGEVLRQGCSTASFDLDNFNAANCWTTEADAKAYAEASLAVRKGKA